MAKLQKPSKANSNKADEVQLDRFKQTARELGCDETGEAFERAFAKAAPAKRPVDKKKT